MISMNKKYRTRGGNAVRVLCVDIRNSYSPPVMALVMQEHGECLRHYASDGKYSKGELHKLDLIEINLYEDFKVDDKVMVSRDGFSWKKRYFAGANDLGKADVYVDGKTSWTTDISSSYLYCRRPTKKEL